MAEAKPFASLSSGLLARKGTAKPAMRPQGFGSFGSSLEDLGWNDMGTGPASLHDIHEAHDLPEHVPSSIEALTPAPGGRSHSEPPAVVEQQRELQARLTPVEPEPEHEPEPEVEVESELEPEAQLDSEPEAQRVFEPEAQFEAPAAEAPTALEAEPEAAPRSRPKVQALSDSRIAKRPRARTAPAGAPATAARAKAAFTLRLDPDRHLKLRLACALSRRSAQQLVTEALDNFLESHPELEALSGQMSGQAN